jgi:TolB-like protein/Tfp pilus assembly protein PilF
LSGIKQFPSRDIDSETSLSRDLSGHRDSSHSLPRAPRKLRFGTFEVDLQERELRNRGIRIKLQHKPFRILELLLENPGVLVTREQLARYLWPDVNVSVDRNLNTAINTLRHVLGDSPRRCRYIETRSGLGYRFIAHIEEIEDVPPARSGHGPTDSIAVLPFENVTGDPAITLVSDGLAENIIAALSALPHVRVIARTTAFRFRPPHHEAQETGKQLNVRSVLIGHVAQTGASLAITAELVEVETGRRLWGERYHCAPARIFSVERDIPLAVSRILRLPAAATHRARSTNSYAANFEAYQDYLKGRYFYGRLNEDDLRKSIAHFEAALAQDPRYALAYTGLADASILSAFLGTMSPPEVHRRAKDFARTALQIDEDLAEAHASLAGIRKLFERDWHGAEEEYRRALDLNPNYAGAHQGYAGLLSAAGRFEEALKEIRCAQELDPLSLAISMEIAWNLFLARDFERAVEESWKTLVLDSKFAAAQFTLGLAYQQLQMHEEAITELRNACVCSGDHPTCIAALGSACATAARHEEAHKILRELDQIALRRYVSPYTRGLIHAGLGETEHALSCLDTAAAQDDVWLLWLNVDPRLDPLRRHARFDALRARCVY